MNTQDRKYNFRQIEQKWRGNWEAAPINTDKSRPKFYCLDMFPYPSGDGLHVGHWRSYVISDVLARYKLLQRHYVVHPMGFDAFGLPAENYAIEHGLHPEKAVQESSVKFKRQLVDICAMYDWDMELATTDPAFYKWTQWIFVQMFKAGLAYEKEMPLNWCQKCKAVLANEEATGGVCVRCGGEATKKNLRQWMLKITAYADRLLNDLDGLDWPEKVKKMQSDWIGKSHGAEIDFEVKGFAKKIKAFTTRPDTLYGATFMTLAPEHELAQELPTDEHREAVETYIRLSASRSNVDRMADKEKTGVFTGRYAVNPATGKADMPVWIADYVILDYGTGAIMCVPGHDERDFEFAKKYGLNIIEVISQTGETKSELSEAYTGGGVLVNSGKHSGMDHASAKEAITLELEKNGNGKATVNYKLRDWVFSRQRYWGEPIPIIHCKECGPVVVPDNDLPVVLPQLDSYQPTDTGESPLALVTDWVNTVCPKCSHPAKRETNTMPQWAGSSWYFLRYPDNNNDNALASKEALKNWLPVDYYVGGVEHAVLHLLYARFYTKFLFDIGTVEFEEPFKKLFNQGMINYKGKKMSKSMGNGVSPDELLPKYGCDALRLYELFIGPPELDCDWNDSGIDGTYRFLAKVWKLANGPLVKHTDEMEFVRHKLIHDTDTRLGNLSMNTVISGFMEHTNSLQNIAKQCGGISKTVLETLTVLLSPFAPHIAEEIWGLLGHTQTVFAEKWPRWDPAKLKTDTVDIALQINGKLRGSIKVPREASKEETIELAKAELLNKLEGTEIVKEICVPGKIVNFVVK